VAEEPTAREIWLAFVIAGLRSRFGVSALALMLALAGWQFAAGRVHLGLVILGIVAFTYARLPTAVAAAIVVRRERRKR
jgi:hypothetical protein